MVTEVRLTPDTQHRLDVEISLYPAVIGLDISCIYPLAPSIINQAQQELGAATRREREKFGKYKDVCKKENIQFYPIAIEVFGSCGKAISGFLNSTGRAFKGIKERILRTISVQVQYRNACTIQAGLRASHISSRQLSSSQVFRDFPITSSSLPLPFLHVQGHQRGRDRLE